MGLVVVSGVEKSLLGGALLGRDGGGDGAAQGMQALGRAAYKLAVAVPVKGVDVLKVDVQAVIVLLTDHGNDVFQESLLYRLVRQKRVGKVGGKAPRLPQVRHREKRRGLARVGRPDEPLIRDGAKLPLHGGAVGEGAERGEPGHALPQNRIPHSWIDIGVDLDLLPHVLRRAGNQKALPDDKAGGVGDLVEALELLHRGLEAPRDGVETVPRFDNINLHKKKAPFRKQTATSLFRNGAFLAISCTFVQGSELVFLPNAAHCLSRHPPWLSC